MNQASTVTLEFNPLAPEVTANPYPFYDRFRTAAPVFKTPLGRWFLTRHSDVSLVLRDRRFGRTFAINSQKTYGPDALKHPCQAAINRMMLFMDPPDHARVRGLFAKAFSPRRMEEMRSRIQSIADQLIDEVEPRRQMDVVAEYAYRLPIIVTCEMLGIPDEDRTQCLASFRMSGRMIDALPMNADEMKQANEQVLFLEQYFHGLFELRRREPRNDLLTNLLQVEEAGDRLTGPELTANIILLFAAGYETTSNFIGNALLALYKHPLELERVKADPTIWPNAIDELLRYDGSVQFGSRTAFEDVELDGNMIKKGDVVVNSIGAANRDPAVYSDPNRLDLTREDVRPLSFGGGIHTCLGAQLARMEAEIALSTLLRRLPNLQLHDLDQPNWMQSFIWRGLRSLRATW